MSTPPTTTAPVALSSLIPGGNPGERPLSVADVQRALRELRARQAKLQFSDGGDVPAELIRPRGDVAPPLPSTRGDVARRVSVMAAHAGAGSSTVALAISDAAATRGVSVHLVDRAAPGRSGLIAAAATELGLDDSGGWRRGLRTTIVIDRRATAGRLHSSLTMDGLDADVTVLDLGSDGCPASGRSPVVLVCRPTVPGVRLAERRLGELGDLPLLLAAVGPNGWAREVRASCGPRLLALREAGRVVTVPMDVRLEISGLTDRTLPKPVIAAGAQLMTLLDTVGAAPEVPSGTPNSSGAVVAR